MGFFLGGACKMFYFLHSLIYQSGILSYLGAEKRKSTLFYILQSLFKVFGLFFHSFFFFFQPFLGPVKVPMSFIETLQQQWLKPQQ